MCWHAMTNAIDRLIALSSSIRHRSLAHHLMLHLLVKQVDDNLEMRISSLHVL